MECRDTAIKTMKMTISTNHAAHLLASDEYAGFSYSGATALAEYLEDLEYGIDEEIEFNTVALRCEFSEYDCLQSWFRDYHGQKPLNECFKAAGIDLEGDENEEELDDLIRSDVQDMGQLIEFDGGVIVSSF